MKKTKKYINKALFKHNSIPFLFASILSAILLFLFGVWIWSASNNYMEKTYWQPTAQEAKERQDAYTSGTVHYEENAGGIPYLYKENNDVISDDFKILSVGDLHLEGNHDDFTLEVLSKFLDKEKPDLVVIDGDLLFWVTDTKWQNKINELFDSRHQYWTFVLGNHDDEGWKAAGKDEIESRKLAYDSICRPDGKPQSKYCLARDTFSSEPKNGVGTHAINIKGKNNSILQTLFMFDYYGINQVNQTVNDWYLDVVAKTKTEAGSATPIESIAFSHKTFYEIDKTKYLPNGVSIKKIAGINFETFHTLKGTNGLIDLFLENNTTKFIAAHDHLNNSIYELSKGDKKLQVAYTCGLQYNCYSCRSGHHIADFTNIAYALNSSKYWYIDGITNLYVNANKNNLLFHKFCQNEGVFDGLENKLLYRSHMFITYKGETLTLANQIILPILAAGCGTYYGFCIYFAAKKKEGK